MIHIPIARFQSCQLLSLKLCFSSGAASARCCAVPSCYCSYFSVSCEMNMPSVVHRFEIYSILQIITVNIIRSQRNRNGIGGKRSAHVLFILAGLCAWDTSIDMIFMTMCNDQGYSIAVTAGIWGRTLRG